MLSYQWFRLWSQKQDGNLYGEELVVFTKALTENNPQRTFERWHYQCWWVQRNQASVCYLYTSFYCLVVSCCSCLKIQLYFCCMNLKRDLKQKYTTWIYNKTILEFSFHGILRFIKASVCVIHLSLRLRWITQTSALINLNIPLNIIQ